MTVPPDDLAFIPEQQPRRRRPRVLAALAALAVLLGAGVYAAQPADARTRFVIVDLGNPYRADRFRVEALVNVRPELGARLSWIKCTAHLQVGVPHTRKGRRIAWLLPRRTITSWQVTTVDSYTKGSSDYDDVVRGLTFRLDAPRRIGRHWRTAATCEGALTAEQGGARSAPSTIFQTRWTTLT